MTPTGIPSAYIRRSHDAEERFAAEPVDDLSPERLRQRWREILFQQVSITLDDPTSD